MISVLTGTNGPFLQIILFELHPTVHVIQRIPYQDVFEILLRRRTHAATYSTHGLAVAEKGGCRQISFIFL
jgi:hypothetical protein